MRYFGNNRNVSFKMLEESGLYDKELLIQLRNGNYEYLTQTLDTSLRENEEFMEPLLYAVKNDYGTFAIFKQYGDNLQQSDLGLAIEVIMEEPELIENTPVSNNKQFIRELAEVNPEVIEYMSPALKVDREFIQELRDMGDKEITAYVEKECGIANVIQDKPELASDPTFMKQAIREDATAIEFASEELRNDYEFIREACKENKEVIDKIVENTDNYGEQGLIAAKDAVKENTTCRAVEDMQQELEKVQEEKAAMEAQEGFDENSEEYKQLIKREKACERHLVFFEKIRNGEYEPESAARLGLKLLKNVPEEYKKEMIQYLKLDEALLERLEKDKEKQQEESVSEVTPENTEKKDGIKIEPEDVEKATEGARISEINETTTEIREEYTLETKEEKEVESSDRGTSDEERA